MKNSSESSIVVAKKSRSTSYPSISLEEAVMEIKKLRANLGKGPYNRLGIAQGLGYKGLSGPAGTKIATLIQFGLVERSGDNYKQTELTDHILYPSENQGDGGQKALKENLIEALRKPNLYSSLIAQFNNQSIPLKLQNNLVTGFGISDKVSESVAADFIKSVEYCGAVVDGVMKLDENNHGEDMESVQSESESTKGFDNDQEKTGDTVAVTAPKSSNHESFRFDLPSGIVIFFPFEMSYQFGMGEFADGIKKIEEKGQEILTKINDKKEENAATK